MEQPVTGPRPSPRPVTPVAYEPPRAVAAFPKRDLTAGLPADITPHLHSVQNS